MGNEISIGEGLVVTVVSMLVVFAVLVLISYLIGLLKAFSVGKKKEEKIEVRKSSEPVAACKESEVIEENYEELVAVIAAAVATNLGLSIPEINIQSIRRVPQNSTPWGEMGKREQLLGKL